jgi:hypothetical protein
MELQSFCVQDKVSGVIELLSSIGIGSADTSRDAQMQKSLGQF